MQGPTPQLRLGHRCLKTGRRLGAVRKRTATFKAAVGEGGRSANRSKISPTKRIDATLALFAERPMPGRIPAAAEPLFRGGVRSMAHPRRRCETCEPSRNRRKVCVCRRVPKGEGEMGQIVQMQGARSFPGWKKRNMRARKRHVRGPRLPPRHRPPPIPRPLRTWGRFFWPQG